MTNEASPALALIAATIAKRTERNLYIDFMIPGRNEPWRCYPATEQAKAKWIANKAKCGWTVADTQS